MSRFEPYLGMLAALFLAVLIIAVSGSVTVSRPPAESIPVATSTLSVVPELAPPATFPNPASETSTTTTSPVQDTPAPKPKKVVASTPTSTPALAPVVAPAPTPATAPIVPSGSAALDAAATALRAALVNVICYVPPGSNLHSISGSGIIIDSKGTILTNAHIAQYFLLFDRGVSCTVRTGSPAVTTYKAALSYIPPAWLSANASVLTQKAPTGTGQYDFAFLAITKSATSASLPSSFPSLPLAQTPPQAGTPVVIGSYGAQFLESSQIQSSLFPTIVFGSVKDVYTFGTNTIDILALGGSAAAQEGSSGGGIIDSSGSLIGTITTSTVEGATDTRSLSAITASYIRAEYASETGTALDLLLAKPTDSAANDFAARIPSLESVLTSQL